MTQSVESLKFWCAQKVAHPPFSPLPGSPGEQPGPLASLASLAGPFINRLDRVRFDSAKFKSHFG